MSETADEVLLTVAQVAARLQVSQKFVWARIADGSLEATRLGRHWRIAPSKLAAYVQKNTGPQPEPELLLLQPVVRKRRRSPTPRS